MTRRDRMLAAVHSPQLESVAREMCEAAGLDPDAPWPVNDPVQGKVRCAQWQAWVPDAIAVIASKESAR